MRLPKWLHRRLTGFLLSGVRPHWYERRFLRQTLKALGVDCVLDVGANIGQYGEELRLVGYDGLIISFEPDPVAFDSLSARAEADPKWHVMNIALGSRSAEAKFNIMAHSVFNSFRFPSEQATGSFKDENRIVDTKLVEVRTLQDTLPKLRKEHSFARPFLKMDTQGYDLEVFEGAKAILGDIVGIQSEVSIKPIYEGMPNWTDAIEHYVREGFELAGLFPVNPGAAELVEFDCFLVQRRAPAGARPDGSRV